MSRLMPRNIEGITHPQLREGIEREVKCTGDYQPLSIAHDVTGPHLKLLDLGFAGTQRADEKSQGDVCEYWRKIFEFYVRDVAVQSIASS